MRSYSEACEQNKDPILKILADVFKDREKVLEIGSGSGQHAIYFAEHLPHLIWQPSDLQKNLASIQAWIDTKQLPNIISPVELDVSSQPWDISNIDAVFTANSFHIMSWEMVESFFDGVGHTLSLSGLLFVYGPFSYNHVHTSQSNERFDTYLKQRDPLSGVRDFDDIDRLAKSQGLELLQDYAMPANNRSLVWQKP